MNNCIGIDKVTNMRKFWTTTPNINIYDLTVKWPSWNNKEWYYMYSNKNYTFRKVTTQTHTVLYNINGNLPVVICLIPVVKVHQESAVHHVCNRGDTDEWWILLIDGLQLHTNSKAGRRHRLHEKHDNYDIIHIQLQIFLITVWLRKPLTLEIQSKD